MNRLMVGAPGWISRNEAVVLLPSPYRCSEPGWPATELERLLAGERLRSATLRDALPVVAVHPGTQGLSSKHH